MRKVISLNTFHKKFGNLLRFRVYEFGLFCIALSCLSLFLYTHVAAAPSFTSIGSDISAAEKNKKQNSIDHPLQYEWEKLRNHVNIYPESNIKDAASDIEEYKRNSYSAVGATLCIGENEEIEIGTGTMMNVPGRIRDVITTVAHVLYDDNGNARKCYFFPQGLLFQAPIRLIAYKSGNKHHLGVDNEWAIAVLSTDNLPKPLAASEKYGAMDYSTILEDISIEEYNRNKNDFLILGFNLNNGTIEKSFDCGPRVTKGKLKPRENHIFHDCGSIKGYSGGPAVKRSSPGAAMVCIHSQGYRRDGHQDGKDAYDDSSNPNSCVRMTREIVHKLTEMATSPTLQLVQSN